MAFQEKQLAQARENSTNAASVYSPGASTTAIIKTLNLCNTSGATVTFRVFLDADGTTYDESTAQFWDIAMAADETVQLDVFWAMDTAAGNLAYRSSVSNAITISVYGAEIT